MKRAIVMYLMACLLISCKKDKIAQKDTCTVDITHQLRNPYDAAYSTQLNDKQSILQYSKFHLYNAAQYAYLRQNGVFLLDHPFDAAPNKHLQYKTEHTAQYGVYYGVVPNHLPLNGIYTEKLANVLSANSLDNQRVSDENGKDFSGNITFFDPIAATYVPLERAQIVIKDGTRIIYAFADSLGNFSVQSSAITSDTVEVLLRFDHPNLEIHTIDMSNLLGVMGINTYSLGFRKSCGFTSLNIQIGNSFNNAALHHSCATLLAYNKFKDFAQHFGFLIPNKKMLFWIGKDAPISTSYAAPMLQNMASVSNANTEQLLVQLLGITPDIANLLALVIKNQLPDIYAPYYSFYSTIARKSFLETLFHELSHASQYAQVGPTYWLPYVKYIYTYGGYGNISLPNSGIVAISEAWAEDLHLHILKYLYNQTIYDTYAETPINSWIPYGLYRDLNDDGTNEPFDAVSGITYSEIYALLQHDMQDVWSLKAKLKLNYPTQQTQIDNLFAHYGY